MRAALQILILTMLGLTLPASSAFAQAARVEFAIGEVSAVTKTGQPRPLAKGDVVDNGELVDTGSGRVQLRFSDGGYVSLQPQTQFRIDHYRFNGKADGTERSWMSLLKGGLRTITGIIGRSDRRNYQVSTAVATIGIRGTEYTMQLNGGLRGSVGEGEIEVCNSAGCIGVLDGESYFVPSADTKPAITVRTSDLPPVPPEVIEAFFAAAEQVTEQGVPQLFSVLASGPGYALAFAKDGGGAFIGRSSTGAALFDSASRLVAYSDGKSVFSAAKGISGTGNDQIIGWGMWTGDYLQDGSPFPLKPGQALHYVVGMPTPTIALLSGAANYRVLGATTPTGTDAQSGSFIDALLSADFGKGVVSTDIKFLYSDTLYQLSQPAFALNRLDASFGGTSVVSSCQSGKCTGFIEGFFAGPAADRAGLAYSVSDFSISGATLNVNGTIAFTR